MQKQDILKGIIGALGRAVEEMDKKAVVVGKVSESAVDELKWAQEEAAAAHKVMQTEFEEKMQAYQEKLVEELEAKHKPNVTNAADKLEKAWVRMYDEMRLSESDRKKRYHVNPKTNELTVYK